MKVPSKDFKGVAITVVLHVTLEGRGTQRKGSWRGYQEINIIRNMFSLSLPINR